VAVIMKKCCVLGMVSCSMVKIYQHFEEIYGLHLQCNGFYFFQDITSERATFHSIIHTLEPCLHNNCRIQC